MKTHPAAPFALALGASLALVAVAVAMTQWMNLPACPLCIIQRMIYLLVAVFALAGLALARRVGLRRLAATLMLAGAGLGVFVAGYQSYLQRFPNGIGCSADSPWWENFVFWAGAKLPLLFQANGVCEDASWKLLGLSIAELSVIAFLGLAATSLWALIRK